MKDINFRDHTGNVDATIRTDAIYNEGNFTIHQTYGLNDIDPDSDITNEERDILDIFNKTVSDFEKCREIANKYQLELTSVNTDGTDLQVLVDQGSVSDLY